jgi:hypothetical protein
LAFAATTATGVAAVAVLGVVSPEQPGHYPTCPFLAMTGYWCPGCGSLRAIHALAVGDPVTAVDRNPLLLALLPLLALAWLGWGLRVLGKPLGNRIHPTRVPVAAVWAAFAVVMAFWVARNIPGWTWLSPV